MTKLILHFKLLKNTKNVFHIQNEYMDVLLPVFFFFTIFVLFSITLKITIEK